MANLLSSSPQNSNYSQQSSVDHDNVPSSEAEPNFAEGEIPQDEQSIGHSKDSLSIAASMSPALSFHLQIRQPEGNNPVAPNTATTPSSTPPCQLTPPPSWQSQSSISQSEQPLPQRHSTPAENDDSNTSQQLQHGLSVSVTESELGGDNVGLSPPGRIGTAASYPCLTSAAITVPFIGSNVNKSWSGNIRSSPILGSEPGHSPLSNVSPNLSSRSRSHTPDLHGHRVLMEQNSGNESPTPSPTETLDLVPSSERFSPEELSVSLEFVDCQSELNQDNLSRSSESGKSNELQTGRDSSSGKDKEKERKESRGSSDKERSKRKSTWYNALNPTYKSRMEDFKRIFKDLPADERLIVDYSCALQRDILLQGRIYVTQNFICFYANIFRWETIVQLRWKDVTSLTKEKTALVIPNAIQLTVENDKYFFTSFGARDKTYVVLFRTWQKALLDKPLTNAELLQFVQSVYGVELGFSSGDDDELLNSQANSTNTTTTTTDNDHGRRTSDVTDSPPLDKLPTPVSVSVGLHSSPLSLSEVDHLGDGLTATTSPSVAIPSSRGLEDHLTPSRCSPPTDHTGMENVSPPTNGSWNEPHVLNGFGGSGHLEPGRLLPGGRKEKLSSKEESNLPTDLSDTTDDDSEDHADEPAVQCPEVHDGRELLSFIVPFSVDQVFNMYFTNNSFYHEFQANRKSTDVVVAPWQSAAETGEKKRQLTYTINLNGSLAVKSCRGTEIQTMLACSRPGQIYVINAEVTNAGIPYADTFAAMLHYCVVRVGPKESRLVLWANIKYKKSVWGLVKTFIEKNTYSGLEEFADQLKRAFLNAVPTHHEERRGSMSRPEREVSVKMRHTRPQVARRRRPNVLCKLDTNEPSTVTAGVPGERSAKGVALVNYTQQTDTFRPASTLSDKAVKVVVATLVVLLVINGLLFWRLWTLESFAQETVTPGASLRIPEVVLKAKPQTAEDWLTVLRHQEALHKVELEKWRQVLAAATGLLRQTEDSLAILKQDVDLDKASNVIQRLKSLVRTDGVEEEGSPLGTREEITGASTRPRDDEGGEDVPGQVSFGQMAAPVGRGI